jgi:hypothetical protein
MGMESVDARRRLLGALERYDQKRPNSPWTFCLATQILISDGNLKGADVFVGLCEQRCKDAACHEQAQRLRSQIANSARQPPEPGSGSP